MRDGTYKMAIWWFVLFSLNSLGTCFIAASAGCVWENLGTQEKITVIVAVFVNWTGTIMAYLSKAAKKGELTIPDPDPAAPVPPVLPSAQRDGASKTTNPGEPIDSPLHEHAP